MSSKKKPSSIADVQAKWEGLFEALNHDSDAVCAIVATSYIDHCLSALLSAHFLGDCDTADSILTSGPLGTLQAKVNVAYCLGLIHKKCKQNVDLILQIRNKFAHRMDAFKFEDPEIYDLTKGLHQCAPITVSDVKPDDIMQPHPRGWFVITCASICNILVIKALGVEHCEPCKEFWDN